MRRGLTALVVVLGCGLIAMPAQARQHHRAKKPAGVKGVVLDATCPGACAVPQPPEPVYTGAVTVEVRRTRDGTVVASQAISDGHFRIRVKAGSYEVSSVPPAPTPPCQPTQQTVCPLAIQAESAAIVAPCETGETVPVHVRKRRFTRVVLHVRNSCIV